MAAWVFSGVLVGFMACLLLSLTLAAHCVNPARRHNSFRNLRLRWNWISRHLLCGAWQVSVPDPMDDPWFQDPRRRRGDQPPCGATAGISPALLELLPSHLVPAPTHSAASGQVAEGSAARGEGGAEECAICQDEFCGGQCVAVLPCRHAFHEACIHKWLLRRATCPMCQREITEAAIKQQQGGLPGDVAVDVIPAADDVPTVASGSKQQQQQQQQQQQGSRQASPQVGSHAQQSTADQQSPG